MGRSDKVSLWCVALLINTRFRFFILEKAIINAAVNGQLELTLLKGCQRFDTVSTSNLKVFKFREW